MGPMNDSPAVKWTRVIRLSVEVGSSSAAVVWSCDAFLSHPQENINIKMEQAFEWDGASWCFRA